MGSEPDEDGEFASSIEHERKVICSWHRLQASRYEYMSDRSKSIEGRASLRGKASAHLESADILQGELEDEPVKLRAVRDAAEEVVAMSEPGMPTLRDVAVDALRAALERGEGGGDVSKEIAAMCRALGDAVKYADESQEEMASLLAEVEAQAAAMRGVLIWIAKGHTDACTEKDCFCRATGDVAQEVLSSNAAGRALLAELKALRLVRDAAEVLRECLSRESNHHNELHFLTEALDAAKAVGK